MVRHVRRGNNRSAFAPWVAELLKRETPKLVAVTLAHKMARIAWKLMITGQAYTGKSAPAAVATAA